jgi:hypothetical protein
MFMVLCYLGGSNNALVCVHGLHHHYVYGFVILFCLLFVVLCCVGPYYCGHDGLVLIHHVLLCCKEHCHCCVFMVLKNYK